MPFPPHHRVGDSDRAESVGEHAGLAEWTEGAVIAKEEVDAGGVVDVVAGEFANGGGVGYKFVKTDGAGWLGVRRDVLGARVGE